MYHIGLDLGQAHDYTGMVILEPAELPSGQWRDSAHELMDRYYHGVHIERFKLGTPYPAIVKRMEAIAAALVDYVIIADATGVGKPVVDMLWAAGLVTVPVVITGAGQAVMVPSSGGTWATHVPKRDLVTAVQVLLQGGRLKFAEGLPEAQALVKELLAFQVKITKAANDTYGAWREGQHDDLVLALALAAWWAQHSEGAVNEPHAVRR